MFDSIHNVGEFLSDHWLASVFPGQLRTLSKEWADRAAHGKPAPPRELAAAAGPFAKAKSQLPDPGNDGGNGDGRRARAAGDPAKTTAKLHDLLLTAAGFEVNRQELVTEHGGLELTVPLAARSQSHSGEALHVLEAHPAASADDLLARDGAGLLLRPLRLAHTREKVQEIAVVTEALSTVFLSATPPRYALVIAGGWLLLTDAGRWSEGRYLLFDAELALARRQETATGELAWHAGLWSADALLPSGDEPASRLDGYVSAKYGGRRAYIDQLASPAYERLERLINGVAATDPGPAMTTWPTLEQRLAGLHNELRVATSLDDFQDIGRRAREILIELAGLVYRPSMLPEAETAQPKAGDAKARLSHAASALMAGSNHEDWRRLIRAAWDLANTITHSSSIGQVDAFTAVQATVLLVRCFEQASLVSVSESDMA